jgi:hypothetical protein
LSPTQLIADYFGFASPTLTGSWRLETRQGFWTVFFRAGQLAGLNAPSPDTDLLSFLVELGQIETQNLTILRRAEREGLPPITLLNDILGGPSELATARRKHALYSLGRLLCEGVEAHSFSDASPPTWAQPLNVESLATPYVALRLQTSELLCSAFGDDLHRPVKLSRSNRVAVAALNLDREALSIARDLKNATPLHRLVAHSVSAQHAVIVYSVALTLLGAELLAFAGEPEPPTPRPMGISLAMPPTVRPPQASRLSDAVSLDVTLDISPGLLAELDEDPGAVEPLSPPIAPPSPVKQILVAESDRGDGAGATEAKDELPPVADAPSTGADLAEFFAHLDGKRMRSARAALDTLDLGDPLGALVGHFLDICDPENPNPDEAMNAALVGLQGFCADRPDHFVGPHLLARIYHRIGNANLANVFHQQALKLGPEEAVLRAWSPRS